MCRRLGPPDLALLPIGAYAPRWFMSIMHVDPAEAVRIHRDVRARQSVGIHWGTFDDLTDETLTEPPEVLGEDGPTWYRGYWEDPTVACRCAPGALVLGRIAPGVRPWPRHPVSRRFGHSRRLRRQP